jgi:hypothetical protein
LKFTITIEDTPLGIQYDITAQHSGCQDNVEQSLAALLSAQIDANLKCAARLGTIRAATTAVQLIKA